MPAAAVKPSPEDVVAEGEGEGVSQWDGSVLDQEKSTLPSMKVPRELLRSFPHSKRVGSYLVGKMINKGSFAKVMEGLHIGTGEKVWINAQLQHSVLNNKHEGQPLICSTLYVHKGTEDEFNNKFTS